MNQGFDWEEALVFLRCIVKMRQEHQEQILELEYMHTHRANPHELALTLV